MKFVLMRTIYAFLLFFGWHKTLKGWFKSFGLCHFSKGVFVPLLPRVLGVFVP